MIRAVIIGFAHMHVNEVALYLKNHPDYEVVGTARVCSGVGQIEAYRYTPLWNQQNVESLFGMEAWDDYEAMLDTQKPDIAFILTENSLKCTVFEACAKRKINVIVEKPMACSLAEAKKMVALQQEYGIEAYVNWPVAWRSYLKQFKAVVDGGKIGKPLKLRYINGHTGPLGKGAKHRGVQAAAEEMTDEARAQTWWHQTEYGGGVFLDIACYGCYFARWLLGKDALAVSALGMELNTPYGNTADNFGALVRYKGSMAVLEGTWTTPRCVIPSGPELMGTEGVVQCIGGAENAPEVKAYTVAGDEIEVPVLPEDEAYRDMPHQYARHLRTGEPVDEMLTLQTNCQIMAILDALMKSAASGKEEPVCE